MPLLWYGHVALYDDDDDDAEAGRPHVFIAATAGVRGGGGEVGRGRARFVSSVDTFLSLCLSREILQL